MEIACWNGEVVRVAFALDTCDREVTAGLVCERRRHHPADDPRSDGGEC
jgi:hypothetical protein